MAKVFWTSAAAASGALLVSACATSTERDTSENLDADVAFCEEVMAAHISGEWRLSFSSNGLGSGSEIDSYRIIDGPDSSLLSGFGTECRFQLVSESEPIVGPDGNVLPPLVSVRVERPDRYVIYEDPLFSGNTIDA